MNEICFASIHCTDFTFSLHAQGSVVEIPILDENSTKDKKSYQMVVSTKSNGPVAPDERKFIFHFEFPFVSFYKTF